MSEGIGSFTIGESQVGDAPWDYSQALISQYATSPTIQALASYFSQWLDGRIDLDNFFDYVWNLQTAQGFGLDIWGRILGISRGPYLVSDQYHFGFDEAQGTPADVGAFGQGVFWSGSALTGKFFLADPAFRTLLFAKAYANISSCRIPDLNTLLKTLFLGRGNAYVQDNGGMSMTYVFNFPLSPAEFTVISTSGVLPRPAGIAMTITHL